MPRIVLRVGRISKWVKIAQKQISSTNQSARPWDTNLLQWTYEADDEPIVPI